MHIKYIIYIMYVLYVYIYICNNHLIINCKKINKITKTQSVTGFIPTLASDFKGIVLSRTAVSVLQDILYKV
jgi:hypothetical protein